MINQADRRQAFKLSSSRLFLTFLVSSIHLIQAQQASSSSPQDSIANVTNQYDNLYLSAPYPDGFGIPLKAHGILTVTYPGKGPVSLGQSYSASDVSSQPSISVTPVDVDAFKAPNAFTLILADANALGNPDKEGNYRHFLENGATFGDAGNDGVMALNAGSGTVVTTYAGPGPLPNTGMHRYAWLLFAQPPKFQAPANLSAAGTGPGHWRVNNYVASTGLGDLVAASFFTVENGHATFPHNATVTHSIPSSNSNGSSSSSASAPTTGSPKTGAQSGDADGLISINGANIIKSIVMGLGVAFSGYILVQ